MRYKGRQWCHNQSENKVDRSGSLYCSKLEKGGYCELRPSGINFLSRNTSFQTKGFTEKWFPCTLLTFAIGGRAFRFVLGMGAGTWEERSGDRSVYGRTGGRGGRLIGALTGVYEEGKVGGGGLFSPHC